MNYNTCELLEKKHVCYYNKAKLQTCQNCARLSWVLAKALQVHVQHLCSNNYELCPLLK